MIDITNVERIATVAQKLIADAYIENIDDFTELFKQICWLQHSFDELRDEDYKQRLEDLWYYIDSVELEDEYKQYLSYQGQIAGISFFDDEEYPQDIALKIAYIENCESEILYYDDFVKYINDTIYIGPDIIGYLEERIEYMPNDVLNRYFDFESLIADMKIDGELYEVKGKYLETYY